MKPKITVKFIKQFQKEQQDIIMKYINITDKNATIIQSNPLELIPQDKISEFNEEITELNWKYICKLYNKQYSEDMDIMELNKILNQFKQDFNLQTATITELIEKFLV